MRPLLYPRLVNEPYDDPCLFVPFLFEKRAFIFDLGDISSIPSRDILKITHIFITHTHMDHFIGFDRILRLFLGREKILYFYGPKGFLKNVEGKLSGYQWNLVRNFANKLIIHLAEINSDHLISKNYLCQNRFLSTQPPMKQPFRSTIYQEPGLSVSTVILDHSIPCLGFSLKERFHINIKKEAVLSLGLQIGPWLKRFKNAILNQADLNEDFEVESVDNNSIKKRFQLGDLVDRIALITPGQKVTYISDVVYNRENADKIIDFAKESDHLFIEGAFLESHRDIAQKKFHLTAWQAGSIAGHARVKQFTLFHISPRYTGMASLFQKEAMTAYKNASGRITKVTTLKKK